MDRNIQPRKSDTGISYDDAASGSFAQYYGNHQLNRPLTPLPSSYTTSRLNYESDNYANLYQKLLEDEKRKSICPIEVSKPTISPRRYSTHKQFAETPTAECWETRPRVLPTSPSIPRSFKWNASKPMPIKPNHDTCPLITMESTHHPELYDGHSDPTIWFREYDTICECNSWNSEMRFKKLIAYLTDAPRIYFLEEKLNNPRLSYQQFKKGLINRFTSKCHELLIVREIQRCVQSSFETFEEYFYTKFRMMNALAPDTSERTKMNFIMEGLNRTLYVKVLEHVVINQPKSIDELFTLIKTINDTNLFIKNKQFENYQEKNIFF